ncbi:MAG: radical SAM protein, partial [Alphaproteobacteria bacterium]
GETRSVTIAPEAGSERMRRVINKNLTEPEILRAAELLAGSGVRALKLYSMIGLPTETDADVLAIADLAASIRARLPGGVGRITLSINPFVPKPWTPLQWEPMEDLRVLRDRARLLQAAASRIPGATVDLESPRDAYWQTLLSRGDRSVASLVVEARREGGRFWPVVQKARRARGEGGIPDPDRFVHRRWDADEPLPWDFIDHSVSKRYLLSEWRKALLERETPPCDVATCTTCGAC